MASHHSLAFVFLGLVSVHVEPFVSALTSDGMFLLDFKNSITDSRKLLGNWNSENDTPCDWTGITCDGANNVTGLILPSASLQGNISDSLGKIATLQNISLPHNNLSGNLPPNIFNLTGLLFLDLADNVLVGSIPSGFQNLVKLQHLDLSSNWFIDGIPQDFANSTALQWLNLTDNSLGGQIPPGLGTLSNLRTLHIGVSSLEGEVPEWLGNLSKLEYFSLYGNLLNGSIPSSLGSLTNLQELELQQNYLSEEIPLEIGNLQRLRVFRLQTNSLTGTIPFQLGNLSATIENIDLAENMLSGPIPVGFANMSLLLLVHLYSNTLRGVVPPGMAELLYLEDFQIYGNQLFGILPPNFGDKQPLIKFDLSSNNLTGPIPLNLCGAGQLQRLLLFANQFSGEIPESLGSCASLQRVRMHQNKLRGSIPSNFGMLQNLNYLELSSNNLEGNIPVEIANCSLLGNILVSNNSLNGSIPAQLGVMASLLEFQASGNNLTGNLDAEVCSGSMDTLNLSHNALSGQVLDIISQCKQLTILDLSYNNFSGSIPSTFAKMENLGELYLDHNQFTGTIPVELTSSTFQRLDISYNNLSGPIYANGSFATLNASDYAGNDNLCAVDPSKTLDLEPCVTDSVSPTASENQDKVDRTGFILCILFGVVGGAVLIFFACLYWCSASCRELWCGGKRRSAWSFTMFHSVPDLTLEDILRALNEDNLVGYGGFGKVYKGEIAVGKFHRGRARMVSPQFVVKRLTGSGKDDRGFRAEVGTVGDIRHNNVIKLLCCCSNHDVNLLVYEYMPNGSLGELLHGPKGGKLEWETRYKIALRAAEALSYLHHDCVPTVLHRDIKSNNILLDENLEPRIADFGLAKLLQSTDKSQTLSHLVGTHGYMAPEHAYSLRFSESSDVYSFGVVLLELVTGKRAVPTHDGEAQEDLVMWTLCKVRRDGLQGVLDSRMENISPCVQHQMSMVLRIGLFCTQVSAAHRPCMRDVVATLLDIANESNREKPITMETMFQAINNVNS